MRIVRYFFVGAVAATVDIGLFALLVHGFSVHYLVAGALTFVLATGVNYVLSVRHVFESGARFRRRHEVALVFVVSAVGLAVNQLVLYLGVSSFGLPPVVAKVLATGMVFFWNYGARAHFVFKARQPSS
jgi:putative flippase GtrA